MKRNVLQTLEDQKVIHHPDVAKAPVYCFGFEKDTARPINENVDCLKMSPLISEVFNG